MSGIPPIPVHHTAVVDEAWDRNAAVSAMPNDDEVLHYCFAWESQEAADAPSKKDDDDADDKKGSYSFPHHEKKGGPANIPACRNGLSRLEGSDIPDGDKAGVKAHLQAHLDDADKGDDKGGKADDAARFPVAHADAHAMAVRLGNLSSADRTRELGAIRAHRVSDQQQFFRITNDGGDTATLDIYDEIGFWGVAAADFSQQLRAVTAKTLNVRINSPGGDVFDGLAIQSLLRAHPADVHVTVDGLAASAASFIAMVGKTITMMPGAMMMIHDAAGGCMGNAAEMQQMADLLNKVSDNLASIYAARAGGTAEQWRAVMRGEQWYTADEAVAAGLADRVGDTDAPSDAPDMSARWTFNFYNYAGRASAPAPTPIAAVATAPTPVEPAPVVPTAPTVTPVVAVAPTPAPAPVVVEPMAPTPVAVADLPPVAAVAPAPATTPVSTPAAAPAVEPAVANQRAEEETPVWNADVFRLAMKERAAAQ